MESKGSIRDTRQYICPMQIYGSGFGRRPRPERANFRASKFKVAWVMPREEYLSVRLMGAPTPKPTQERRKRRRKQVPVWF
eukprot:6974404-Pyramimonas_sp.AAC.1